MSKIYKLIQDNLKLERLVSEYKQILGVVPFVNDSIIKGGFRVVTTIEDRDNINCCYRKKGMIVSVLSEDKWYKLTTNGCSNNWEELNFNDNIEEGGIWFFPES